MLNVVRIIGIPIRAIFGLIITLSILFVSIMIPDVFESVRDVWDWVIKGN